MPEITLEEFMIIDAEMREEKREMNKRKHAHYYKDVSNLNEIDVYRVIELFNVTNPCLQHALKKIMVAGGRGAGKDISRDVREAIETLERWEEMQRENNKE